MANKRIQDLPVVGTINGSEEIPINKGGITNKATVDQIKNHLSDTFESSSNKETTALSDSATKYPSSKAVLLEFGSLKDGSTKTLAEIENDYNNKIDNVAKRSVDFVTDNATTRLQILESDRIKNFMLSYNGKTEIFFGSTFTDASWTDDANWKTFTYDVDGYSFLSNTEIAKLASYPLIPNDSARFLRGDGVFESIATGSGGYASNVYLSNVASNIAGYKTLSYTNDAAITTLSGTSINNNVILIEEFAFPLSLGVTVLDAGAWKFILNGKVSNTGGETYARIELYTRSVANAETLLFTVDSQELNNLVDDNIIFDTIQPIFNVSSTDRIVIKLYVTTTSNANKTLSINLGGTKASYMNTPVAIRHSQLRGLNDDANVQHMTSLEKSALGAVKTKTVTFTTDIATTRKLVTLVERVNGYKLTYSNKTEQYIGNVFTDTEWVKDSNWVNFEMFSNKNIANGYVGLDSNKQLANELINTNFRKGFGYLFDGIDDYLTVQHNDKINFGTDDFSIQVSFICDEITQSIRTLYDVRSTTIDSRYGLILYGGKITFVMRQNGVSQSLVSTNNIIAGSYHNVFCIRKGLTLSIFDNGVLIATSAISEIYNLNYPSSTRRISSYVAIEDFSGKISLIRLFNRALSQSDVTYYENGGRPDLQRLMYQDVITDYRELVTNGTFDNTNLWVTPAGWSISNGKLNANNASLEVSGGDVYIKKFLYGKIVKLSMDVTVVSGSIVRRSVIGSSNTSPITASGTYTSTHYNPYLYVDNVYILPNNFIGSIDNVSVKQVGCVLELLPENALANQWLENQNGLNAIASGNPAINTELPITDHSIVDNVTNNIATTIANRDYILPAGYIVDSVCVNSTVALTALQLVNITTTETLLTGKTASATANKHLPITADQSSSKVGTTIRLNCAGNTGLGFNIVINIKKCL